MFRLTLLLLLLLSLAGCAAISVPLPSLDGTEAAPDIALPTPDGDIISLSDLKGQVVFVNFWGTYCPPCVDEMPDLQATYEDLGGDQFTILGINVEEQPTKVSSWLEENGVTFPVIISDDASINPDYALRTMPTTWFVDASGILRGRIEGQLDASTAKHIATLLMNEPD